MALPQSLTYIGECAFTQSGLQTIIIPSSVEKIDKYAFSECKSLSEIKLNEGLVEIGQYAFQQCAITEITIPSGVTTIGWRAFENCYYLSKAVIPESVTDMGGFSLFYNCADGFVIYGEAGSYAEKFATDEEIKFVAN